MCNIKIIFRRSLLLIFIFMQGGNFQLIRSNEVYQTLVHDISDYYDCHSVILFHVGESSKDTELFTRLKSLHQYLSKNMILTTISNVDNFIKMNKQHLRNFGNHLFIFLDDSETLMYQFITKLAPLVDLSHSLWLIFIKDDTAFEKFNDFYIPFDSHLMVSQRNEQPDGDYEDIFEIYRMSRESKLYQNIIGRWKRGRGIYESTKMSLSRGRNDMDGHELRVVVDSEKLNLYRTTDKIHPRNIKDISVIIFTTLESRLNFTIICQETSNEGNVSIKNNWSPSLTYLINNISDIQMMTSSINDDLMGLIEWTTPFLSPKYYFYFRLQHDQINWKTFLNPLGKGVWILLGCVVLFSGTLIKFILLYYEKKASQMKINRTSSESSNSYFDVFSALCGQAMPLSKISSIRIIQYTVHLTAVVIFAAYSGILTSILATNDNKIITPKLQDIINDDSFQVGVVLSASNRLFFENSQDREIRQLTERKRLFKVSMPVSSVQGLQWACDRNKYAMYVTDLMIENSKPKGCNLFSTESISDAPIAYGIQRHSPYRAAINHYLSLLRENGILKKTVYDVMKPRTPLDLNNVELIPVDFYDIIPIISFLGGAYILSIIFLLFEHMSHARMLKIRHQKTSQNLERRIVVRCRDDLQLVKSPIRNAEDDFFLQK